MTEEMKYKQLRHALLSSVQDVINVSGKLQEVYNDAIARQINVIVSGMYNCLLEENSSKLLDLADVVRVFTSSPESTRH